MKEKVKYYLEMGNMIDQILDFVEEENYNDAFSALDEAMSHLNRAFYNLEDLC